MVRDSAPHGASAQTVACSMPAQACDSHCHIFGPASQFPFAPERSYTPEDAGFDMLHAMHQRLGLERGVIVQPNCHGYDMSAVVDALRRGQGQYRAVALLPDNVSQSEIARLDGEGVRGVRFNFVAHLAGATPDDMLSMAERIATFGWHLCIHTDGSSLLALLPKLQGSEVPFIIDHMGRVDADEGVHSASFQALLSLRDDPLAWVKISGVDRLAGGHSPYDKGHAFVRALVEHMPDRLLWGTDWPHPNVAGPVPDDQELLNLLCALCPDAAVRERILVHNPQQLYRFKDATS
ncbi:amidohydrolase family protein [Alcaligenaceae bacterium]|nr:amidohydrolase family protein [Alcaligenaceae bacterium]